MSFVFWVSEVGSPSIIWVQLSRSPETSGEISDIFDISFDCCDKLRWQKVLLLIVEGGSEYKKDCVTDTTGKRNIDDVIILSRNMLRCFKERALCNVSNGRTVGAPADKHMKALIVLYLI